MVGEVYQVKLIGNLPGDNFNIVLHYKHTDGVAVDHSNTNKSLATAVETTLSPLIRAVQTTAVQYTACRVQCVSQPKCVVYYEPMNVTGVAELDALPSQDAILVTKRGLNGGRENVGKTFVPGISEELVSGDSVDTTQVAVIALGTAFMTVLSNAGNDFKPVIWHAEAQTSEEIASSVVRGLISKQGRRRSRL